MREGMKMSGKKNIPSCSLPQRGPFTGLLGGNERGSVTPIVAVCLAVIFGLAALVIDLGWLFVVKGELQNAADAGVLAGVVELVQTGNDAARSTAISYSTEAGQYRLNKNTPTADSGKGTKEQGIDLLSAELIGQRKSNGNHDGIGAPRRARGKADDAADGEDENRQQKRRHPALRNADDEFGRLHFRAESVDAVGQSKNDDRRHHTLHPRVGCSHHTGHVIDFLEPHDDSQNENGEHETFQDGRAPGNEKSSDVGGHDDQDRQQKVEKNVGFRGFRRFEIGEIFPHH